MVPPEPFTQEEKGKPCKNRQRDDFLNDFQLIGVECLIADPVGRDHKTVFKKSHPPADEHSLPDL